MHLSSFFHKTALLLVLLMSFHTIVVPVAGAVMVETETLVSAQEVEASRAHLATLLAREDVGAALKEHGVTAQEAQLRVDSLSDQEVMKLAQNIDLLPAAGDFGGLIGALVFVFLVLLFTDIMGVTDVYPFVHKR